MADEYVTKEVLELQLENMTLNITKDIGIIFDEKISVLSDRMDVANIDRRNNAVLELTGFSWEEREKSRLSVQHGYQEAVEGADTKKKVKGALIGGGFGGFFAWLATYLPWDN